mgnify:CR=1 FL=1
MNVNINANTHHLCRWYTNRDYFGLHSFFRSVLAQGVVVLCATPHQERYVACHHTDHPTIDIHHQVGSHSNTNACYFYHYMVFSEEIQSLQC